MTFQDLLCVFQDFTRPFNRVDVKQVRMLHKCTNVCERPTRFSWQCKSQNTVSLTEVHMITYAKQQIQPNLRVNNDKVERPNTCSQAIICLFSKTFQDIYAHTDYAIALDGNMTPNLVIIRHIEVRLHNSKRRYVSLFISYQQLMITVSKTEHNEAKIENI